MGNNESTHVSGSESGSLTEKVLVVNKLYIPVHLVQVKRAISLLYRDKAEVIVVKNGQFLNFSFDDWTVDRNSSLPNGRCSVVHTPSLKIQVPRIIRLQEYKDWQSNEIHLNRRNVFARDHYRCQYCGEFKSKGELSLDHVVPLSQGGETSWSNLVAACRSCNVRKGGRLLKNTDMSLSKAPQPPSTHPVLKRKLQEEKYQPWKVFIEDSPSVVQVC